MDEPPGLEPEPGPPNGAPQTGWVVAARDAPDRPPSRGVAVVAWLGALLIAGFAAWIRWRAADGSDSYRAGVAVGAFVAPFLFAAILRVMVMRIRWGRFDRAAVRSHWVPLGAIVIVVLSTLGNLAELAPPAPVDASTAMHVNAPFTLREADAATIAEVERAMREEGDIDGSIAVRHVIGEDGSTSLFVAADAGLDDDDLAEVTRGLDSSSAATPTIETIAGEEIAVLAEANPVIATWVDAPLILSVYAGDLTTLRAVVEAVIESG